MAQKALSNLAKKKLYGQTLHRIETRTHPVRLCGVAAIASAARCYLPPLIVLIMLSPFLLLIFYRHKRVVVRHSQYGLTKNGYYGFSPTYFCFGWFVTLFRGEISIAANLWVVKVPTGASDFEFTDINIDIGAYFYFSKLGVRSDKLQTSSVRVSCVFERPY